MVWANAVGYRSTYPHVADRLRLVETFADNKAALLLYGAGRNLVSVGGYTAWRGGGILALFGALFGMFAAARALRGDEDAGRTEVVLVGALTRSAWFGAVMTAVGITVLVIGMAASLGAIASSLDVTASVFFGLVLAALAAAYAAIGAFANQVAPTRRGALGLTGAVLAADFALRIVADTAGHPVLHWFGPLGWAEEAHAFTGSRPWVLLLALAVVVVATSGAAALNRRRDLGSGLVASRDTAPLRVWLLSSPTALALRLERFAAGAWLAALLAFGLVVGSVAKSIEDLDLPQSLRDQIAKVGGIDITQAKGYVGLTFVIFVFAIAIFVCGQFAALRDDESSRRFETLFALPYGRTRGLGGRIVLMLGVAAACALGAGLGIGIGAKLTAAHLAFPDALAGGINAIPPEVLIAGVGALLLAFVPRLAVGALYAFVVAAFVLELFGAILSLPHWVLDLSPFHHVAPVPARGFAPVSTVSLLGLGAVAIAAGIAGYRRRDLLGD